MTTTFPRAPSPNNNPPRVSTSSIRPRRSHDDFEKALLNPNHTLFLSGSQVEELSSATAGSSSPFQSAMSRLSKESDKRSFEDDLNSIKNGHYENGATPQKGRIASAPGVGIVAATPSSMGSVDSPPRARHLSTSTDSTDTPTRSRIKGKAVGLDAEIAANQAKLPPKRRSIFRSPGTASSPDLATLVKKAKDRKPIPPVPNHNQASSSRLPTVPSTPPSSSRSPNPAQSPERLGRQSSISSSGMGTINEMRRKDSTDGEGFKSMRSKARGMFGRMFGGGGHKEPTTPSSRTFPSPPQESRPAVPSLPSNYAAEAEARRQIKAIPSPPQPQPLNPQLLQSNESAEEIISPGHILTSVPEKGEESTTPGSRKSGKPLPTTPLDTEEERPEILSSGTVRSMHRRQPAYDDDGSPDTETSNRIREASFSEDVDGMFANIGNLSPANELGLGPESLRQNGDGARVLSLDRKKSPKETQEALGVGAEVPNSPIATRTSSLPTSHRHREGTSTSGRLSNGSKIGEDLPPLSPKIAQDGEVPIRLEPSLDFNPPQSTEDREGGDTIRLKSVSLLGTPKAPSVRLVASPPTIHQPLETLDITTDDIASSTLFPQAEMLSPVEVPTLRTPNGEDEINDDEEKGRKLACEFLENDFSHIPEEKVAMFLGGPRLVNAIALKYYMQYFDMKGQNLVEAFRELCGKLHLKAESQEIDRIIDGFSARFYECNPSTIFGSPGVVHTITGAMLMLNTDLHIADLAKHMSRNDFIRNAMSAIKESTPMSDGSSTPELIKDDGSSVRVSVPPTALTLNNALRQKVPVPPVNAQRSASAPIIVGTPASVHRVVSEANVNSSGGSGTGGMGAGGGSSSSLNSFIFGKAWEAEAENALRDIYSAVRSERILLPTSASTGNNGVNNSNRQSMISVAGSLDMSRRGGSNSMRNQSNSYMKRSSVRGFPSPYGADYTDSNGRLSPTGSYATSINEAMMPFASLGFASNLSHTVIREQEDETHSIVSRASLSTVDELNDDELALLGAPWAKEGLLWHKLYWDAPGKKAKKSDWEQFFSVIQQGELHMFVFGNGSSGFMGGSVGGGNWLSNAKPTGTIDLMHVLASAIPKGGVSDRPHCFSISAASGQTTLFQAGTEDLVLEWVQTCNYWAARRSRQPLQGGVSNMEYGWQRVMDPMHDDRDEDKNSIRSARSNFSKLGGTYGRKQFSPMDRVHINDWKPPIPAGLPSPLDEEQQLETLTNYVKVLKGELGQHKTYEEPMIRQYTPQSKNMVKAKENWKARSLYLHTEIIKYETYVDSLKNGISLRFKKAGERKLEKSLAMSVSSLHGKDSDVGYYESRREEEEQEEEDEGEGVGNDEENTPPARRTQGRNLG